MIIPKKKLDLQVFKGTPCLEGEFLQHFLHLTYGTIKKKSNGCVFLGRKELNRIIGARFRFDKNTIGLLLAILEKNGYLHCRRYDIKLLEVRNRGEDCL